MPQGLGDGLYRVEHRQMGVDRQLQRLAAGGATDGSDHGEDVPVLRVLPGPQTERGQSGTQGWVR